MTTEYNRSFKMLAGKRLVDELEQFAATPEPAENDKRAVRDHEKRRDALASHVAPILRSQSIIDAAIAGHANHTNPDAGFLLLRPVRLPSCGRRTA